jgi:peptide/nickel transport system permease protein
MFRFVVRRLLWFVPILVLVTFVVYVAVRIGWDPVASYKRANPRASQAKVDQYIEVNGLYPGFTGYVRGYAEWLWQFVQGPDAWPRSIKGQAEVYPQLRYAFFNTLRLAGIAATLGIAVGLIVGIIAARKPGGVTDSSINGSAFFLGAIPPFVSGVVLQLVFAVQLKWLPPGGVYPPGQQGFDLVLMLKHLVLPVAVVAIQTIAVYARYMRASLLEVSTADYLRTARSKGISDYRVLMRHGVRNALVPVVTIIGIDIGALLGGLIITENIFNYPGMGVYFIKASTTGDFPLLMPYLVVIVTSVLLFNLLADLSYALLDPRIRLD